jgi:hypothetical protein
MTPSCTHASESYALIGHESALFHISHVSVFASLFFDPSPFSPPSYLMVNTRLIVPSYCSLYHVVFPFVPYRDALVATPPPLYYLRRRITTLDR